MRTLKFIVNGQIITKDPTCDFSNLVPGTHGYLKAEFEFSSEWDNCVKVAEFIIGTGTSYAVPLEKGKYCNIPDAVCDREAFKVMVVGQRRDKYRIRTNDDLIVKQNGGDTV